MAIKPTKRELQTQETKRRIATAAKELFGEYGFEPVSVKDIAERAGVTTGALYYHFKNKDDLIMAVYGENATLFRELSEKFARSEDPLGDIVEFLGETMVKRIEDDGFEFTRYRVLRFYDYNHSTEFDDCFDVLVRRGLELGCFREGLGEDELVDCLTAIYRGAVYQYVVSIPEVDLRALVKRRLRMTIEGIAR
ncbi:MAG TPA: TetR/AcrR family transcriptional regulator [Candidatus Aphodovivens avistercoris]|nr:TetR/AcrR family transcriptional regulator [Candidatus Aphodovivens avistercoris]